MIFGPRSLEDLHQKRLGHGQQGKRFALNDCIRLFLLKFREGRVVGFFIPRGQNPHQRPAEAQILREFGGKRSNRGTVPEQYIRGALDHVTNRAGYYRRCFRRDEQRALEDAVAFFRIKIRLN